MNIDDNKTIEQLENKYWGDAPKDSSGLVVSCHNLRRKPLSEFEPNDYRVLIGQNIGIKYLVPMAIELLEKDPFVEATYYPGDLFLYVMKVDSSFWKSNHDLMDRTARIYESNRDKLLDLDISNKDKDNLLEAYQNVIKK